MPLIRVGHPVVRVRCTYTIILSDRRGDRHYALLELFRQGQTHAEALVIVTSDAPVSHRAVLGKLKAWSISRGGFEHGADHREAWFSTSRLSEVLALYREIVRRRVKPATAKRRRRKSRW